MALELRPNCELCDKDLPPQSTEAMICSYECTFCSTCVEQELKNVCPNCGGGFVSRPIRPAKQWRSGVCVDNHPPSQKRVKTSKDIEEIRSFTARVSGTPPEDR
ncbi:MAG: DUF1272 domain-containing protein [Methyloligellaceae bacterium]